MVALGFFSNACSVCHLAVFCVGAPMVFEARSQLHSLTAMFCCSSAVGNLSIQAVQVVRKIVAEETVAGGMTEKNPSLLEHST